jgi:hypothetical protein
MNDVEYRIQKSRKLNRATLLMGIFSYLLGSVAFIIDAYSTIDPYRPFPYFLLGPGMSIVGIGIGHYAYQKKVDKSDNGTQLLVGILLNYSMLGINFSIFIISMIWGWER